MTTFRWRIGGACMFAVAATLVAVSFGVPRANAGIATCVTVTPVLPSVQPAQALPVCTPITIVRSATPTITATVPATSTPVPPTPAPPTVVPPTATPTKPSGGAGAQVTAPNTGSGPQSGGGYSMYLLLAAGVVAAIGSGSLVVATRRRR